MFMFLRLSSVPHTLIHTCLYLVMVGTVVHG